MNERLTEDKNKVKEIGELLKNIPLLIKGYEEIMNNLITEEDIPAKRFNPPDPEKLSYDFYNHLKKLPNENFYKLAYNKLQSYKIKNVKLLNEILKQTFQIACSKRNRKLMEYLSE